MMEQYSKVLANTCTCNTIFFRLFIHDLKYHIIINCFMMLLPVVEPERVFLE